MKIKILDSILSNSIKVRFNNPDYYEKAAEFLKTDNLEEIAKFVNGSNSKAGISYWACRGLDLNKHKKYKKNFINSAYTSTSRSITAKKINKRTGNSFGYTGWTEEMPNGKKYFCRSTPEFVFVLSMFHDNPNINLEYESKIFRFDGFNYKPDFFLYNDYGKLYKIVEVKSDNRFLSTERYKIIKRYFDSIKINYEVVYDINSIIKKIPDLNKKIEEWKSSSKIINSCAGELNPRYNGKTDEEIIKITKKELRKIDHDVLNRGHYIEIARKFNLPQTFSKFRNIDLEKILNEINKENNHPEFKNWQERREYRKQYLKGNLK